MRNYFNLMILIFRHVDALNDYTYVCTYVRVRNYAKYSLL